MEHEQDSRQESAAYKPIEDYAIIGDLHTIAMVGNRSAGVALDTYQAPHA